MTEKEKLIGKDGTVYVVDRGFLSLPPKSRRDTETRERLQELFASGEVERLTQKEIAERVGVSQWIVSKLMKEMGVSRRRRPRPRRKSARERLQKLLDSGKAEGMAQKEIGERIGVSQASVARLMKGMGVKPSYQRRKKRLLQELFDSGEAEGMTQGEIAERIGLSPSQVSYLMKEMGIPYQRPRRASPAQKRLQEFFDSGEAEGMTQKEIAERIGVGQARVSYLMKEMGIPYQRPRRASPTQKRFQELFDSGEAEGMTRGEIAERIGVSQGRVSQLMKEAGISYRRPQRASPAQKRLQEFFDSGEAEGMTQKEIAERIGLSPSRVYQLMKEMGIPYQRPRRVGPTQKRLQKLFDSGEAEGLTQKEIAERIGVSPSQVSYLMKRAGLSRR